MNVPAASPASVPPDSWPGGMARHAPWLCRAAAYSTAILACAPFLYHLAHGSSSYLGLFEDDYFYYALVADKLVDLGKLSYDGVTLTNGFHPLWLLVIALLRLLCGRFGTGFYVVLTLIAVASAIVTFELGRRLARLLGATEALAAVVATTYSLATARLLSSGMECTLAVPLFLWLLIEIARPGPITTRRAAWTGLLSSSAILARLDLAIAVALLIAGVLVFVRPPIAKAARLIGAFCLGGVLLPLYLTGNLLMFGSWLPVSAMAKRLQTTPGFNFWYARAVAQWTIFGPTVGLLLPFGLIALALLLRLNPALRPRSRFAGGLTLVFAFVFFGINALSGWIYFGWYSYPLVPALVVAQVFVCERWASLLPTPRVRWAAAAVLVALGPAFAIRYFVEHGPRWSVADNSMLQMSYDLSERMRERRGLVGMGAIAGVATYVMDRPVLQLEGIAADRRLVEHIRSEDPLPAVLREYDVDYLVVSLVKVRAQANDGCYLVTQPHAEWAGERTAKMRGAICAEPVERFITPGGPNPWSVFPDIETLVWDLRQGQWK